MEADPHRRVGCVYCASCRLDQPHLGVCRDKPHRSWAQARALSGKWSGTYSGSFTGSFKLTWQQSGHNLGGTITISRFNNEPTSIDGTVHGATIRFGTVGSEAITYAGSVSGKSMSGTWKIQAAGRSMGGGSWNASKSS